jgi:hypothetical protein
MVAESYPLLASVVSVAVSTLVKKVSNMLFVELIDLVPI